MDPQIKAVEISVSGPFPDVTFRFLKSRPAVRREAVDAVSGMEQMVSSRAGKGVSVKHISNLPK